MKTVVGIKKLVFYSAKQWRKIVAKQCFGNLKQNSWFEKWWNGFHDFFHTLFLLSVSSSTSQKNRFWHWHKTSLLVLKIFGVQSSPCVVQYFLGYFQHQISAGYRSRTNTIGIISGRYNNVKSKSIPNWLMFLWSCLPDLVKGMQVEQIIPTSANTHRKHLWDMAQPHSRRTSSYLRSGGHFSSPWFYFAGNSCDQQASLKKKKTKHGKTESSLLCLSHNWEEVPSAAERWLRGIFFGWLALFSAPEEVYSVKVSVAWLELSLWEESRNMISITG